MSDILKLLDVARKNIFKAQVEIEKIKAENEKLRGASKILDKYYDFLYRSMLELTDTEELFGISELSSENYCFNQMEQIDLKEITSARQTLKELEGEKWKRYY